MDIILPDFLAYVNTVATPLIWLVIFALLDLGFGVLTAVAQKRFTWDKITDYLSSNGLPILGWLVAEFVLLAPAELVPEAYQTVSSGIGWTIYATVSAKILASLFGHFASFGVLTGVLGKIGIQPTEPELPDGQG
jgi:hypothetical protein